MTSLIGLIAIAPNPRYQARHVPGKKSRGHCPVLQRRKKIGEVVRRVRESGYADEMIVVDDGSTDHSAQVAEAHGATVLKLGEVLGVGAAIRHGLMYAKENFELLVVIAGNNKDEPKEIPRLLSPIVERDCDFVQGSRFLLGGEYGGDMPLYRKFATRLHPAIFSFFTGRKVTESTNGFRAIHRTLLEHPKIDLDQAWLDGYELEPYLYYKAVTLGLKTAEVPVTKIYPPKKLGYTKMKPIVGWWSILRPLFLLRLGLRS